MDIVIKKLELRASLTVEEKGALRSTFVAVRQFHSGQDLMRQGDRPAFVGALLSGVLCRYKPTASGRRQIVSFVLPGDIFDLHSFTIAEMDHSIGAITFVEAAVASHAGVETLADAHPPLGMLLWRDAVVEASIFREWIVNCGRRSGYQRTAHLFCEMHCRMAEVGLANDDSLHLPLTQSQIGDATGLSDVHVNRILAQLRLDGLITYKRGKMTVPDWQALADAGDFDPSYLHAQEPLGGGRGFAFAKRR